jgi:hypothetical protein
MGRAPRRRTVQPTLKKRVVFRIRGAIRVERVREEDVAPFVESLKQQGATEIRVV